MKRKYVSPKIAIVELENIDHILVSSYTDIGGVTNRFNARRLDSFDDYDEEIGSELGSCPNMKYKLEW